MFAPDRPVTSTPGTTRVVTHNAIAVIANRIRKPTPSILAPAGALRGGNRPTGVAGVPSGPGPHPVRCG
ncbi:hypothetical protein GCM10012279_20050 [Micromonospora yangpuensis]|nr:hypothetical protein GCM10012279_20050 [Micromonospora yangpuensis]